MPDFGTWREGDVSPLGEQFRAQAAWRLIQRQPTTVELIRGSTMLSPQTVRVEYDNTNRDARGESNAVTSVRDVVLFGVRNHPTQPDSDIQREDRFALNGRTFQVIDVIIVPGGIQAECEAYD